ncbi:MAG: heavy metal-binding domain-containing protein [Methanomicrobiaceae archaeon]|uniref:Uncharacterized protein n=1 Tax=hydrocarbon metagenome TaxID=938273 RepID=A0A0W8FJ23_9ZZZZ|nr:heavy metal-binding domain-containing protein [Methanomicrobiaceae archaeon]MDD5418535.1 heavy metal-binding domain-containing protein [Methanomicrobiaceae archaeon]
MIVTTTEEISGQEYEVVGLVTGNTVRAKHLGNDIMSGLKSLVGGELRAYTDMLSEARTEAIERMIADARRLQADAVVNVRFSTAQTAPGAAEILAYGTAVRFR